MIKTLNMSIITKDENCYYIYTSLFIFVKKGISVCFISVHFKCGECAFSKCTRFKWHEEFTWCNITNKTPSGCTCRCLFFFSPSARPTLRWLHGHLLCRYDSFWAREPDIPASLSLLLLVPRVKPFFCRGLIKWTVCLHRKWGRTWFVCISSHGAILDC